MGVKMKSAILLCLCLFPLGIASLSAPAERGIFSHEGCGEAKCGQGEGDCDSDDDCVLGLVCEFDNWWGKDHCVAGPKTVNGKPSSGANGPSAQPKRAEPWAPRKERGLALPPFSADTLAPRVPRTSSVPSAPPPASLPATP